MMPEGLDFGQLLQQAQQMQAQLATAQQELAELRVTGTAGGGLVTATITGAGELVSLDIDRSVVDPDDVETLADLVLAAVRDAREQVAKAAAERMGPLAQGLGGLGGALGGLGGGLGGGGLGGQLGTGPGQ
jgi:nucleoid-associated protein EbfC